jgi:hypothetical protein
MNFPKYALVSEFHKKAYMAFLNMHTRCYNPRATDYKYWGGRGIRVEGAWNLPGELGFSAFLRDLGLPPDFHSSLDRIDVNKNYCRENCRWADRSTQASNKQKRQYSISYTISYDKAKKKYKLYRHNLNTKVRTYLAWFDTEQLALERIELESQKGLI